MIDSFYDMFIWVFTYGIPILFLVAIIFLIFASIKIFLFLRRDRINQGLDPISKKIYVRSKRLIIFVAIELLAGTITLILLYINKALLSYSITIRNYETLQNILAIKRTVGMAMSLMIVVIFFAFIFIMVYISKIIMTYYKNKDKQIKINMQVMNYIKAMCLALITILISGVYYMASLYMVWI